MRCVAMLHSEPWQLVAPTHSAHTPPLPCAFHPGNTYERSAIEAWLQQRDTSPLTNEALAHKLLLPNKLVRALAAELGAGSGTGI